MNISEKWDAILKTLSRDEKCKPRISVAQLFSLLNEIYPQLNEDVEWQHGQIQKLVDKMCRQGLAVHFPRDQDGVWEYETTTLADEYVKEVLRLSVLKSRAKNISTTEIGPVYMMDKVLEWFAMNPSEFKGGLMLPRHSVTEYEVGSNIVEYYFPELNTGEFVIDLGLILDQLVADKNLDLVSEKYPKKYSINFKGKFFSRNMGGYAGELDRKNAENTRLENVERNQRDNEVRMRNLTRVLAVFAGLMALFELMKMVIDKNEDYVAHCMEIVTISLVFSIGIGTGLLLYKGISEIYQKKQ